jgi:hypothetical protein
VKTSPITIAPTDTVDLYERTAREFLREILGLSYDECLITDESNLSDFSACGLPEELSGNAGSLQELYQRWDKWVVPRVCERYGIASFATNIRMTALWARIEAARHSTH